MKRTDIISDIRRGVPEGDIKQILKALGGEENAAGGLRQGSDDAGQYIGAF